MYNVNCHSNSLNNLTSPSTLKIQSTVIYDPFCTKLKWNVIRYNGYHSIRHTHAPTNLLSKQLTVGVVQGGGPACLPSNPLTTGGILNTFVSVSSLMRDEGAGNVHWSSFIAAAVVTVTRYTSSPIEWTHSLFTLFLSFFFFFFIYIIS